MEVALRSTPAVFALMVAVALAPAASARVVSSTAASPATPTTPPPASTPASTVADAPPSPSPAEVASKAKAAPGMLRVVVTDLDRSDDVSERLGRVVADDLVAELRKLQGISVVSMDEVRSMLAVEADRQLLGCDASESCLSEIADALGADVVVDGRVATIADARIFSLRRIDQRRAAVTGSVDERLVMADGEELLAAIGPAIEKLFPDMPLRAGAVRGVAAERVRVLNPPPLPPWSTVVVAVAGVSSLVSGGVAYALAAKAISDGEALAESSREIAIDGALVVKQEADAATFATASAALVGVGVVLGAAAGVMALFTDWNNAAAE